MELFITKKFGRRAYPFVFTGADLHAVVMESEHLSFDDVPACGLCGSDNLSLSARVAQDKFKYVSVRCGDCRADLTMGKTQKDDRTYFLRRNESGGLDWKAYTPDAQ